MGGAFQAATQYTSNSDINTHCTNPININCEPPTREEVRSATKSLKNGKSAGPDNIPAEALKADIETSTDIMTGLLRTIWEKRPLRQTRKKVTLLSCRRKEISVGVNKKM